MRARQVIICDIFQLFNLREVSTEVGLIGHSLVGGGIAQLLAIDYPERVKFLILLNTGPLLIDNPIGNIFLL